MSAIHQDGSATRSGLDTYRSLRRELEDAVLPLAASLDGRRFTFQASVHDEQVMLGGYVRLRAGDQVRLGQVTRLDTEMQAGPVVDFALDHSSQTGRAEVRFRAARGNGVILEESDPFTDARFERATPDDVVAWLGGVATRGAALPV